MFYQFILPDGRNSDEKKKNVKAVVSSIRNRRERMYIFVSTVNENIVVRIILTMI